MNPIPFLLKVLGLLSPILAPFLGKLGLDKLFRKEEPPQIEPPHSTEPELPQPPPVPAIVLAPPPVPDTPNRSKVIDHRTDGSPVIDRRHGRGKKKPKP